MSSQSVVDSTRLGATSIGPDRCAFEIWAPSATRVHLQVVGTGWRRLELEPAERGYHRGEFSDVEPGTRYWVHLDGGPERPDLASRWQPEGIHGPSAVLPRVPSWTDVSWRGLPVSRYTIYELHVGTFTDEGTFDAAIDRLPYLKGLGITAVELMPIVEFPGSRNWGYDGVLPFATHHAYGGPAGLVRFVDACHRHGLAVVLDVVYNHIGPEGNAFHPFGPYFQSTYKTFWGDALNFDGPGSDEVRRYFIENALMWLDDFHIDALRLDAVHAIVDRSPRPFLAELSDAVGELSNRSSWKRHLIAESDANDPRLLAPTHAGGLGMDAVWADDFHHGLHVALTGETKGYYADYAERDALVDAANRGFAYTGQFSKIRGRRHGAPPPEGTKPESFVVCIQNHDQIGNRMLGDRISTIAGLPQQAVGAAMTLLSPHTPLLFMGEEYGETRPFPYFVSHTDPELMAAVRKGRAEEFSTFQWQGDPPDPGDPATFEAARIDPRRAEDPQHAPLARLYRRLLELRNQDAFARVRERFEFERHGDVVLQRMSAHPIDWVALFNLSSRDHEVELELEGGTWRPLLDSGDPQFGGAGPIIRDTIEGSDRIALPPWGYLLLQRG